MEEYKDFRPTSLDSEGLNLPDQQDWLVGPVVRTRDSGLLTQSNFESFLDKLGGESNNVKIHRFGHWGPGWYEIVLIRPSTKEQTVAEKLENKLNSHPILDENDLSSREQEAYSDNWESIGKQEFIYALCSKFNLSELEETTLDSCTSDKMLSLYESLIPSGDTHDDDGYQNISRAMKNCGRGELDNFFSTLDKVENVKFSAI